MDSVKTHVEISARQLIGYVSRSAVRDGVSTVVLGCSASGCVDREAPYVLRGCTVTRVVFDHVSPDAVRRASPDTWSMLERAMASTTHHMEDA